MTTPTSAPAHHRPGGGFRNPWPGAEQHGLGGLLRWTGARAAAALRGGNGAAPPTRDPWRPPRAEPSFARPRLDPARLSATWVGHSSWLVQAGGLNVLLDPVWGERASPVAWAGPRRWAAPGVALERLPPVDVVLLSHDHYDHFDEPTIRRLAGAHPEARWLAPLGVGARLRALGVASPAELDWWDEAAVAGLRLRCTPAQHFSGRSAFDRDSTLWCGWALRAEAAGRSAWFVGDTGRHPEFATVARRAGPFDLVLMPVGAYEPRWFMRPVHMNPEDAVAAYAEIAAAQQGEPPLMAGMHWGTFKLTDEAIDEPPRRVRQLWELAQLPADRLWIPAFGETRTI